jgi:hypothetical protein
VVQVRVAADQVDATVVARPTVAGPVARVGAVVGLVQARLAAGIARITGITGVVPTERVVELTFVTDRRVERGRRVLGTEGLFEATGVVPAEIMPAQVGAAEIVLRTAQVGLAEVAEPAQVMPAEVGAAEVVTAQVGGFGVAVLAVLVAGPVEAVVLHRLSLPFGRRHRCDLPHPDEHLVDLLDPGP